VTARAVCACQKKSGRIEFTDITRMNLRNGTNPIIPPSFGEAMVGWRRFPGAPAVFTAQSDA